MNSIYGQPTWELESRLATAKAIAENTLDAKTKELALSQIDDITEELARRNELVK